MERASASRLSRINSGLLIAIILINAYVILAPFAPAAIFNFEKHATSRLNQLNVKVHTSSTSTIPSDNRVVIPSMLLDQPIFEGSIQNEYKTLSSGIWRWPNGSTPDKGGNTILIGHRFTYTNPRGVFYELDKVKVNDELAVFWSGKKYLYKVASVAIVPPGQTTILDQTKQSELTLYTCTPTWNPKDRLVVVANLETNHD